MSWSISDASVDDEYHLVLCGETRRSVGGSLHPCSEKGDAGFRHAFEVFRINLSSRWIEVAFVERMVLVSDGIVLRRWRS